VTFVCIVRILTPLSSYILLVCQCSLHTDNGNRIRLFKFWTKLRKKKSTSLRQPIILQPFTRWQHPAMGRDLHLYHKCSYSNGKDVLIACLCYTDNITDSEKLSIHGITEDHITL